MLTTCLFCRRPVPVAPGSYTVHCSHVCRSVAHDPSHGFLDRRLSSEEERRRNLEEILSGALD